MGRLAPLWRLARQRRLRRAITAWLLPIGLTLVLLFGVHSFAKADTPPSATELSDYLTSNSLSVGAQAVDGYQQIYYNFTNHRQIFISSSSYNHLDPTASGEYVVWVGLSEGGSQIYQYDVLTGALVQLTSEGTNQSPTAYQNTVTWENWDTDHWRIMYYDGFSVRQISDGNHSAVRGSSNGQQVIYAEQLSATDWRTMQFFVNNSNPSEYRRGPEADTAFPRFKGSTITTDVISYYN